MAKIRRQIRECALFIPVISASTQARREGYFRIEWKRRASHGPRAQLAGLTQRSAGRPEAAAAQFRESERLLRELLGSDPDNEALHAALALTLACLGRGPEARDALGQVELLVSGRSPSIYRGPLVVTIAHAHREMNNLAATAQWLRRLFAEPSDVPFTAASLAFDPRFGDIIATSEIKALLHEFAHLNPSASQSSR